MGAVLWPEPGLVHSCFGIDLCHVLWIVMAGFLRSEFVDCFKVLLLNFLITCLVVLVDICVLIYWQMK